ncbi:MAG TPA: carboxypeptidase-like regulatory domain-containing protein [Longimicrobium sp.]|nr:carboxypeptidase-like regulatory domain-containing protein [Longimicrobium sp.]
MIGRALLFLALISAAGCDALTGGYRYGSVKVVAADRSGAPVSGVSVILFTPDYIVGEAVTGDDGVARFDPVGSGEFAVKARVPNAFLLVTRRDSVYRPPIRDSVFTRIQVREGEETTLPIPVHPLCCGTVRFRATDARGAPVSRARAIVFSTAGVAGEAVTGADGLLVLNTIPEGEYVFRVVAPDSAFFLTGRDSVSYRFRIAEGQDTTVTYRMRAACCATFRVTVRDQLGAAIPGVEVLAYGLPAAGLGKAVTDAAGTAEFRVLAGTYGVRLERLPLGYVLAPGGRALVDNIVLLPDGSRSVTLDALRQ